LRPAQLGKCGCIFHRRDLPYDASIRLMKIMQEEPK